MFRQRLPQGVHLVSDLMYMNMQLAILVIVVNVTFKAFKLFNFQWSILSRHGSKSCNLSGFKCGTDFLCPWHGKLSWGNENIPSSIVIFHKYVLFCPLGNISKQSILKEIKPIHNLLIFSFLSLESLWLLTKNIVWIEFVVANVSY